MSKELIDRLRRAASVADQWDIEITAPPVGDWSDLMDEAADYLETLESEEIEAPSFAPAQAVE